MSMPHQLPVSRYKFLVGGLLILVFSLSVWPSLLSADDLSGRWVGRWTTYSEDGRRPHEGTLRMNLRPQADGSYLGTFSGRFAIVFPYVYRARVEQYGDVLVSTKRLGPLGSYTMTLQGHAAQLQGDWTARSDRRGRTESGGIQLRRCSTAPNIP